MTSQKVRIKKNNRVLYNRIAMKSPKKVEIIPMIVMNVRMLNRKALLSCSASLYALFQTSRLYG